MTVSTREARKTSGRRCCDWWSPRLGARVLRVVVLVWPLFFILLWTAEPAAKSVAVVYDDSGSMRAENRWRYASFSLQTVLALLGDADTVHIVRMSEPGQAASAVGASERAAVIEKLKSQPEPNPKTATPFQSVETALKALRADKDPERWLVVITDGEFNAPPTADTLRALATELARRDGIRTVFMLMGRGADERLAQLWEAQGQAQSFKSGNSAEIIDRMNDVAAVLMMRPTGANDLRPNVGGSEVTLSPVFPLRRLTLLQQTRSASSLAKVASASGGGAELQPGEWLVEMPRGGPERNLARVTHLRMPRDGQVMTEGVDSIRIRFAGPVERKEIRFLPEVGARLDVTLRDDSGAPLAPEKDGTYIVCGGKAVRVVSQLTSDDGRPLAKGMTDISALRVTFSITGDPTERVMRPDAERKEFSESFTLTEPEVRITAAAAYPGYFNFKSNLFTLRSRDCRPRVVSLTTQQGGTPGSWRSKVTDLDHAAPLEIVPLVDGAAVDPAEFAGWSLALGAQGTEFDLRKGERGWLVSTGYRWCTPCFTPAGRHRFDWKLTTSRADDVIELPRDFVFEIEDASLWDRCWRLVAGVILTLAGLWWAYGIWKKPRFARSAIVQYRREGFVTAKQNFILPGPWYKRWLVPYLPERKMVDALLFIAASNVQKTRVLLSKRSVSKAMRIDGQPILAPDERMPARDVAIDSGTEIHVVLDGDRKDRKIYRFEARGRG